MTFKTLTASALCLFFPAVFFSQTFTNSNQDTILDNSANSFSLDVSGLPNLIDTNNFGLESICLTIVHTYLADLTVNLVAPDGSRVTIISGIGGDTDFLTNTCFSMDATGQIGQGISPYTDVYIPMGQLGLLNNQQNPNGSWTLEVNDNWAQDAGNIYTWSLTFGSNPADVFTINASDLPMVFLETNGQEIPNEPKIDASVKIIYNGEGQRNFANQLNNHFSGNCGIEIRGASSSGMPKKSYSLEIRNSMNTDMDTSILGFPSESDFVLSAQYTDKTLLRNMLTMHLIQGMGWYAPRFRPVELFINNEYKGVYIFMEKVKKNSNRVDISTLNPTENSGDNLTGGYILKLDKNSGSSSGLNWESPFAPVPAGSPIVIDYYYPDETVITTSQQNYIRNYFTDFEAALAGNNFTDPVNGYRKYLDYGSALDALLISEFSKNVDAYRKSFYIYKDKDSKGGKLVMAPIWDYDLTYGNVDFCDGQLTDNWQYNFNYVCGGDYWINPFWFPRMMQDPQYTADLRCRWNELKTTVLHPDSIFAWIDQKAQFLNESQGWNYTIWQTMGSYVWPNSFVGQNYQEEIDFMKSWIQQRYNWLDANIPGDTSLCEHLSLNEAKLDFVKLYPNPAQDIVTIECKEAISSIVVTDLLGKILLTDTETYSKSNVKINLVSLESGTYQIHVKTVSGERTFTLRKTNF